MNVVLETLRDGVADAWKDLEKAHADLSARKTPATLEAFDKALQHYSLAFEAYDGEVTARMRVPRVRAI